MVLFDNHYQFKVCWCCCCKVPMESTMYRTLSALIRCKEPSTEDRLWLHVNISQLQQWTVFVHTREWSDLLPWQPSGFSADKLWYPGLHKSQRLPIVLFLQMQPPGSLKCNHIYDVFPRNVDGHNCFNRVQIPIQIQSITQLTSPWVCPLNPVLSIGPGNHQRSGGHSVESQWVFYHL